MHKLTYDARAQANDITIVIASYFLQLVFSLDTIEMLAIGGVISLRRSALISKLSLVYI